MILLLLSLASAADVERYPYQAEVRFAGEDGVHRLDVPALLRSHADPPDGRDLLLVDATGEAVPVAWARGRTTSYRVPLRAVPTAHDTWDVRLLDRPIDALDVVLPEGTGAATVTVEGPDGPLVPPALVWRQPDAAHGRVDLPPTRGPLRVSLTWHQRPSGGDVRIEGLREPAAAVAPTTLPLPVASSRVQEDGWALYTIPLPHALPVRAVTLHPEGDVFDRGAQVRSEPYPAWNSPTAEARVSRVHLGAAAVDQTRIPVALPPTSELLVYVGTAGAEPLVVPEVSVELEGVTGFVWEPGPGPHVLYGGAPPGTSPPFDLAVALPELAAAARGRAEVDEVAANPRHVPPEVRSGLALPGAPVEEAAFGWRRPVVGQGLVRVPLDAHVLGHARSDLGDVRLVDPEGRQIPYVLRRKPVDRPFEDLEVSRTEDGERSRLRVALPDASRPVSTVTLATDAPLFHRAVTLSRARGDHLEPLRVFSWSGSDRPTSITLAVDQPVGDELVVTIENGSNPPLPISEVRATWPSWEVVAWIPEAAELRYGAPRLESPRYDLALVGHDVVARASTEASLAAPVAVAGPARTLWDRLVLLGGLGVLVLGLLGLTVSLVRAVPGEP